MQYKHYEPVNVRRRRDVVHIDRPREHKLYTIDHTVPSKRVPGTVLLWWRKFQLPNAWENFIRIYVLPLELQRNANLLVTS